MTSLPEWIFGYGSLIWRPDFPYIDRFEGCIDGWMRRFYQGSPDHRGTPSYPGRVVTLLPDSQARTWGVAYRLAPDRASDILHQLDVREQGGYARFSTRVFNDDNHHIDALVYIATAQNEHYLGPEPLDVMAQRIIKASGPSGLNRDYLFLLESSLQNAGIDDAHVTALANTVRAQL